MSACLEILLAKHITDSFGPLIESRTVFSVRTRSNPAVKWASFKEIIAADGYETEDFGLAIETHRDVRIEESDVLPPTHLRWLPVNFGPGGQRFFNFRETQQRKKNKYWIRLSHLKIPGNLLRPVYEKHSRAATALKRCFRRFLRNRGIGGFR